MSLIDTLKRTGFTFSEDATFTAKDDTGSLSRCKVGGTLAVADALDGKAIVRAIAANSGGQININGVSDKVSAEVAAQVANDLIGSPLSQDDAFDIAIGESIHEATREHVRLQNEGQEEQRERLLAESAERQAAKETEESHVGADLVHN